MNSRRLLAALLTVVALSAAPAPKARAADARSLTVKPVAPAEMILRQQRKGLTPHAVALSAIEREVLGKRLERQRLSRAFEAEMHAKAFRVGAGIDANRRPGWVSPQARAAKSGFGAFGTQALPQDTVRVAFIRIDFLEDRGGSASSGTGRFNLDPSDTLANPVDRPPHNRTFYRKHGEALSNYFDVQTYGRTRIEVDVWPAEEDSAYHLQDMADLGPWRFGNSIFRAAVDMMRLCFFAADSQSIAKSNRIPWDKYDRFMIIHAGSDLQSDLRGDSKEDIPSFTMFVDDTDRVIFPDSTTRPIDRVAFIPETINQDDAYGAINGVVAHENGHNFFGFGDVYDIQTALPTVGYWSLMDSGNLVGARLLSSTGEIFVVGLLPPSIDPFQRDFASLSTASLLNFREPGAADTAAFALHGSQRTNDFVKLRLSTDEYLILENRYLSPAAAVRLLQDDTTRVVLGPREPDRFEWDALLPGSGVLAWHIDESVIPFTTSLRVNPDFGFNTNHRRLGLQMLEADGLDDLGDVGSPFLLGSELDPFQASVMPTLTDDTSPSVRPNQGTRPHLRIDFLDDASDTMHVRVTRQWQPQGWPVVANFPPGGPRLLTIDVDGDGKKDVVWAGGDTITTDTSLQGLSVARDSAAIFAVRFDGRGLNGADSLDYAHLDRRPLGEVAAFAANPNAPTSPALVVATTQRYGASDVIGGRVWAFTSNGAPFANFPVTLPSPATTPPIVAHDLNNTALILVGCEDGRIRGLDVTGQLVVTSTTALSGPVSGRLAYAELPPVAVAGVPTPAAFRGYLAAADTNGQVTVLAMPTLAPITGWPRTVGSNGFAPDFLFMRTGGVGSNADADCGSTPSVFVHMHDRVWGFCASTAAPLEGWGTPLGDTLAAGLAAGDPDGDGFPEIVALTQRSKLVFLNRTGRPAPGWPRAASADEFRSSTPPVVVDVTQDGRPEMVALTASGVLSALDGNGRQPTGWPLATGAGAAGSLVATDLEGDGTLELVGPDRFGRLYAYTVGTLASGPAAPWLQLGADAGRTCYLAPLNTSTPLAPSAGPLVAGSLKAYPNPARQKPVQFAYQLTEDASVEVRILDASGHEVTRWTRQGRRADNLDRWDPTGVPAGLYVAHLRFSGPGGARTETVPLGIIR
ncbi:MAG: hypothetical protein K8R56_10035 [Candidatus Eisenbacteria bacterium]|nr:hypothetical protein [Candidatus Eisenbacteria bacterium]